MCFRAMAVGAEKIVLAHVNIYAVWREVERFI